MSLKTSYKTLGSKNGGVVACVGSLPRHSSNSHSRCFSSLMLRLEWKWICQSRQYMFLASSRNNHTILWSIAGLDRCLVFVLYLSDCVCRKQIHEQDNECSDVDHDIYCRILLKSLEELDNISTHSLFRECTLKCSRKKNINCPQCGDRCSC